LRKAKTRIDAFQDDRTAEGRPPSISERFRCSHVRCQACARRPQSMRSSPDPSRDRRVPEAIAGLLVEAIGRKTGQCQIDKSLPRASDAVPGGWGWTGRTECEGGGARAAPRPGRPLGGLAIRVPDKYHFRLYREGRRFEGCLVESRALMTTSSGSGEAGIGLEPLH